MGSDMIVALHEASANSSTLFGLNHHAAPAARHSLLLRPGQMHESGATIPLGPLELSQVRQTFTVLGLQPQGTWGFTHGVNEHRVAIGVTDWQSKLPVGTPALSGPDLARLALERARGALQAVEILTDLFERYPDGAGDHIFLIADAGEAFVLETAGRFWALLECGHTRVVTDAAMIRQDWRRLAPGLASFVIDQGWWQDDGSKIDFVRCLGKDHAVQAHKRWGHASLALAQQNGAIDAHFLRRLLTDHYLQNRELIGPARSATLAASFLIELQKNDQPIVAFSAFGNPDAAVYFPICLCADLPAGFNGDEPNSIQERTLAMQKLALGRERGKVLQTLERLQVRFDQDADEFLIKAHDYTLHGKPYLVRQIASEMMHNHVQMFDREYRRLFGIEEALPQGPHLAEEVLFFA
jgi:hypothetical protein